MYLVVSIIILSQPLGLNSLLYLVLCLRAGCLRVYLIFSFYFWTLVFPYETTFRFSLFIFPLPLVADYCCMFLGVCQAFCGRMRITECFLLSFCLNYIQSLCLCVLTMVCFLFILYVYSVWIPPIRWCKKGLLLLCKEQKCFYIFLTIVLTLLHLG